MQLYELFIKGNDIILIHHILYLFIDVCTLNSIMEFQIKLNFLKKIRKLVFFVSSMMKKHELFSIKDKITSELLLDFGSFNRLIG